MFAPGNMGELAPVICTHSTFTSTWDFVFRRKAFHSQVFSCTVFVDSVAMRRKQSDQVMSAAILNLRDAIPSKSFFMRPSIQQPFWRNNKCLLLSNSNMGARKRTKTMNERGFSAKMHTIFAEVQLPPASLPERKIDNVLKTTWKWSS